MPLYYLSNPPFAPNLHFTPGSPPLSVMSKETSSKVTPDSIDFQNPLFVGEQVTENNTFTLNPNSFELKPFNPSNLTSEGGVDEEVQFDALQDYRWRLRVSPCSVSCGKGEGAGRPEGLSGERRKLYSFGSCFFVYFSFLFCIFFLFLFLSCLIFLFPFSRLFPTYSACSLNPSETCLMFPFIPSYFSICNVSLNKNI